MSKAPRWKQEEEALLRQMYTKKANWRKIGAALGRSPQGVKEYARKLGLKKYAWKKDKVMFTPLDWGTFRKQRLEGQTFIQIGKAAKRSAAGVRGLWVRHRQQSDGGAKQLLFNALAGTDTQAEQSLWAPAYQTYWAAWRAVLMTAWEVPKTTSMDWETLTLPSTVFLSPRTSGTSVLTSEQQPDFAFWCSHPCGYGQFLAVESE